MVLADDHADELGIGIARVVDKAGPIAVFLSGDRVPVTTAEGIRVVDIAAVVHMAVIRDDFADVLGQELVLPDRLKDADPYSDVIATLHQLDKRSEDSLAA